MITLLPRCCQSVCAAHFSLPPSLPPSSSCLLFPEPLTDLTKPLHSHQPDPVTCMPPICWRRPGYKLPSEAAARWGRVSQQQCVMNQKKKKKKSFPLQLWKETWLGVRWLSPRRQLHLGLLRRACKNNRADPGILKLLSVFLFCTVRLDLCNSPLGFLWSKSMAGLVKTPEVRESKKGRRGREERKKMCFKMWVKVAPSVMPVLLMASSSGVSYETETSAAVI